MRKDRIFLRVSKITDLLGRGEAWTANEIAKQLNEPKGTVSPFISAMLENKHLVQTPEGLYKLPDWPKRDQVVSEELKRFFKKKYVINRAKRQEKAAKIENIVNSLFDEPKPEPKKLIEQWIHEKPAKPEKIQAAVELLKSNGYKVLKPTTEFKEI
jgi:hypothetical protein